METFTRRFSWDAVSRYSSGVSWQRYISYEGDRQNIKTNGDIRTVRSRYTYRDTRISVWNRQNTRRKRRRGRLPGNQSRYYYSMLEIPIKMEAVRAAVRRHGTIDLKRNQGRPAV